MTLFRDARTRILLYFLLGIALPSGLLGYLAFRGIQNDRALVERERRNELQRLAAQVQTTVAQRLASLTAAVSRGTSNRSSSADLLASLRDQALLEALFTVSPDSAAHVIASRGLRFTRESQGGWAARSEGRWSSAFQVAEEREIRFADLSGALHDYRLALARAPDDRSGGEALNAMARVQRKLGQFKAAARSYERIRAEYGELRLAGGMVLGPAAGLEHGAVLLAAGDSTAAVRVLLQHYADLLEGRWVLTPAQFDFVSGGVQASLDRLATSGAFRLGDTLLALRKTAISRREHALGLLAFEAAAERMFRNGSVPGGPVAVLAGGKTFHASLSDTPPPGAEAGRWGFVFDLRAMAAGTITDVLASSGSTRAVWVLRTAGDDSLAAAPQAASAASPRVAAGIAGYTPWSFELAISAGATAGAFLTSRRAVYFYAFVLLASILLFGLVLTLRTVGRELELARLKSDFVSTVSHEFKSPLTAIRHMAELLTAGRVVSEERRLRYFAVLQAQSERLAMLVDNVLDLGRMEAGQRPLVREPVALDALIDQAVAEVQQRVAHQGFAIRFQRHGPLPALQLDADAIRQALGNLLDNAVKYSGSSREVVVKSLTTDGRVEISVQDFGIGIERHDLTRVFERFYRSGDPLTRTVKGTGLGLALVKEVVEAQGGTVEARSTPGRGSTFSLHFPLANQQPTARGGV